MDYQLTCVCGSYVVAPAATFVTQVQQHAAGLHPDRPLSVEQINSMSTPA